MNIPAETKPFAWGAAAGAVVAMIIGFNWGGWVTGGTAEASAAKRSSEAVVGALAPVCVEKFGLSKDANEQRVAFKKTDQWSQGDFIEKGGWAASAGTKPDTVTAVARACALLLAT